jgi:hypothetical protein
MKAFLLVLSRDVLLCTVVPTVSIDRWLREGIACWKSWDGTWCRFTQLLNARIQTVGQTLTGIKVSCPSIA